MFWRPAGTIISSLVKPPSTVFFKYPISATCSALKSNHQIYSKIVKHRFQSTLAREIPLVQPKPLLSIPTTTRPIVGYWMMASSALVFSIVIVGGLTRLTESGLSMVDWSLLGSRPPSSQQEWEAYFEKYKQFPEYQINNKGMTLEEFKSIFWFEYGHRMLGRFIGGFFALPGLYFIMRGYCTSSVRNRIFVIGSLIGCQGLLGWYMVKSGLEEKIVENREVPRVSAYRLAAHLGSAFVIYSLMFATGLNILTGKAAAAVAMTTGMKSIGAQPGFKRLRSGTHLTAMMVFYTALSGAFVAGLDAGLIYNTFPKMADRWVPSEVAALEPFWKNLFENPATVQFNHRVLAISTYTVIVALWLYSRRMVLPKQTRLALNSLLGVGSAQVTLGISTLLLLVPVPLAAAHQGGSLTLLTVAIWLMNTLKHVPK